MADLLRACHGCRQEFPPEQLAYVNNWLWCAPCLREERQAKVGVPKRYRASTLARWGHLSPEVRAAIDARQSLFICGAPGRGKTDLVLSMVNEWLTAEVAPSVGFWEWEWFIHLLAEKHGRKYDTLTEEINRAIQKDYLILDDLGGVREDFRANDYQISVLWRILNERYNREMYVTVTSNKTLAQLAATFDDRIASRLHQVCFKVFLDGQDFRRTP